MTPVRDDASRVPPHYLITLRSLFITVLPNLWCDLASDNLAISPHHPCTPALPCHLNPSSPHHLTPAPLNCLTTSPHHHLHTLPPRPCTTSHPFTPPSHPLTSSPLQALAAPAPCATALPTWTSRPAPTACKSVSRTQISDPAPTLGWMEGRGC